MAMLLGMGISRAHLLVLIVKVRDSVGDIIGIANVVNSDEVLASDALQNTVYDIRQRFAVVCPVLLQPSLSNHFSRIARSKDFSCATSLSANRVYVDNIDRGVAYCKDPSLHHESRA